MAIEERLELDISEALRGIDRIDSALAETATQFKVELAQALDVLSTGQSVPINADTAGLTEEITGAVDAVATSIDPTVDAAAVDEQLQLAFDSVDATLTPEVDEDSITAEIDAAIESSTATLAVDADTSAAEDAMEDLATSASSAGGSVGALEGTASGLGIASGLAAGNIGALSGSLTALGPGAVAAGGSVLALTGFTSQLVAQALEAETAERRFNQILGEQAEAVNQIDVGGLNLTIEELARTVGSSDEPLQNAAASIFALGESSGVAAPQISVATEQIVALSARAVAMNPALGEAGDVANRLTTALARGGRALAPYGIALSTAEINARAFNDTGKTSADQLTIFEKAAAGAAITTEKLGDTLETSLTEGAQSSAIQLAAIRERIGKSLEDLGKPLLVPILDTLKAATPDIQRLAAGLGQLSARLVPLAADLLPLLSGGIGTFSLALNVALPILDALDAVLSRIPGPVLEAVGSFLLIRQAIGPLPGLFNTVATAVRTSGTAMTLSLGPIGLAAIAITGIIAIVQQHSQAKQEERAAIDAVTSALKDSSKSYQESFVDIARSRLEAENQIDDLRRLGLTYQEVADLAGKGAKGQIEFLKVGQQTGEFRLTDDLKRKAIPDLDAFVKEVGGYEKAIDRIAVSKNPGVVKSFEAIAKSSQDGAKAFLEAAVASGQLTESELENLESKHKLTGATVDYIEALHASGLEQENATGALKEQLTAQELAADKAKQLAAAQTAITEALQANKTDAEKSIDIYERLGSASVALRDIFVGGQLSVEQYRQIMETTGLTMEELLRIEGDVGAATQAFTDTIIGGLQGLDAAISDIQEGDSLQSFLDNFTNKVTQSAKFVANIQTLINRGAIDLASALAEGGSDSAGLAAEEAVKLNQGALSAREKQIDDTKALEQKNVQNITDVGRQIVIAQQQTVQDAINAQQQLDDVASQTAQRYIDALNRGIAEQKFDELKKNAAEFAKKIDAVIEDAFSAVQRGLGISSTPEVAPAFGPNAASQVVVQADGGGSPTTGGGAGTTVNGPLFGGVTFNTDVNPVQVFAEAAFRFVEGALSPK